MRTTSQQMPCRMPEQRIERFRAVLRPIGALPDKQAAVGPIPDVIRIRIEDRRRSEPTLCGGSMPHTPEARTRNQHGKYWQALRKRDSTCQFKTDGTNPDTVTRASSHIRRRERVG